MSETAQGPQEPLDRSRLIYRWDLDKTYLRTEFDTVRDLLARAFERAADKRTVPGAAALLRELRATEPAGIYILSGSPEQMRRVLEAKLRLDGIRWDGFTLKPSLRNLLRGHIRFLKDQVGFKLGAMLGSREPLPAELDEVLFGDDAETDVFTYSLYADLCAGRVSSQTLLEVLERAAVTPEEVPRLLRKVEQIERRDHCRRIFIHLDRMSSLSTFEAYGPRVCPFYNYFQPALSLLEMGAIDAAAALRVAADLVIDQAFTADALLATLQELAGRGQVGPTAVGAVLEALGSADGAEYAGATPVLGAFAEVLARTELPEPEPAAAPELDYVELLTRERARAKAAKLRVLGRH
ncbi:MAG: hypothetical protein OXT09_30110 [Myxococcales bacterium]|nr:hypothetical protein [Myxococcales bacterium]